MPYHHWPMSVKCEELFSGFEMVARHNDSLLCKTVMPIFAIIWQVTTTTTVGQLPRFKIRITENKTVYAKII